MANLVLPANPNNGDQVTHEGTTFTYVSLKDVWTREMLQSKVEDDLIPTTDTSISSTSITGSNLVFTSVDGSTSNVSLNAIKSGAVTVYANESDLPSSGIQDGDHGFVTGTDNLYIRSSGAWRVIDAVNLSPTITASVSSHNFGTIGESIDITYTTSEPEGTPVTVTTSNSGITDTTQVDISHHTGNNTVTVVSGASTLSGGVLTISVTDGINIGTAAITLNVSYGPNWSTSTQTQKIGTPAGFQLGGANHSYGSATVVNGDYAAVSYSYHGTDFGRIYIYNNSGSTWLQQSILYPDDANDYNQWGGLANIDRGLDFDNNTVVAGAEDWKSGANEYGKVYVWTRSGSSWSQQQGITPPTADGTGSNFGAAVAISGDTLAVGADSYDAGGIQNAGAVYIYVRSGSTWSLQQKIEYGQTNSNFGSDVDLDGEYLIVGASNDDTAGTNSGRAFVYKRSGTTWSLQQNIDMPGASFGENFGKNVKIDGDTIAVRAVEHDSDSRKGEIHVYTRSGTTWSHQQKIEPLDVAASDNFGASIDLEGDVIVGASSKEDTNGKTNNGAFYIFERSGSTWTQTKKHVASDPRDDQQLGHHQGGISISGDTIMVGSNVWGSTLSATYVFNG